MTTPYEETVKLNEQLVKLVVEYKKTKSPQLLSAIAELLLPVTRNEANIVANKLSLPLDVVDDMVQESYFKLTNSLSYEENWNPEVCPVFITFWKLSVRRFLLTAFHKKRFSTTLQDSDDKKPRPEQISQSKIDLETIRNTLEQEILSWRKSVSLIPLVLDILHFRVLALDDEKKSQQELAKKHNNVSQAFISLWENWIKDEIRKRFGDSMS